MPVIKKVTMRTLGSIVMIVTVCFSADNVAPSTNPPGSLSPAQAPQFVIFGVDDNKYTDGVEWAAQYLRARVNPKGTGNPATFDSMPARAAFYVMSLPAINNTMLQKAIVGLYLDGHEIGNHTLSHLDGNERNFTDSLWKVEMFPCQTLLTDTLAIPASDIWGFRTPYLAYNNNTFRAVKQMNFVYDCSIEEGEDTVVNGKNFLWPYTLDDGSPGANFSASIQSHPPVDSSHDGLWEIPVYLVIAPPDSACSTYGIPSGLRKRLFDNYRALTGDSTWDTLTGKITGLDYNFWFDFNMTKADYIAILKYTLDLRLAGNRAPFFFGVHSDYYSLQYISEPKGCNTDYIRRREAMVEFLDYALTKQEVRIVPPRDLIRWMRQPVALGQQFTGPCTLTVSVTDSGTVSLEPKKNFYSPDENVTLTATPASGWVFDRWAGRDITGLDPVATVRIYKNLTVRAIFKPQAAALDTSNPSASMMTAATWRAECDEIGSKIGTQKFGDTAAVKFWQSPQVNDTVWPWISLTAAFVSNFTTVTGVEFEYTCDNPLVVQLVQPELGYGGDESYAFYQYVGPKSEQEWKKIRASIKEFYQPDWTPLASKKSLMLATVRELCFIPSVGESGDSASLAIRNLRLFYTPTPIAIYGRTRRDAVFSIRPVSAAMFRFSAPEGGNYSIALYSVKGSEVLSLKDVACKQGTNCITVDRILPAAGVYIVRVTSKGLHLAPQKMMLRR